MWEKQLEDKIMQNNSTENDQSGERHRKACRRMQKNSEANITQRNREETEKIKLMVQRGCATPG